MEITPSLPQDESKKVHQLSAAVISERISAYCRMVLMRTVPIWIVLSSTVILYNSEFARCL